MRPPALQGPGLRVLSWNVAGIRSLHKKVRAASHALPTFAAGECLFLDDTCFSCAALRHVSAVQRPPQNEMAPERICCSDHGSSCTPCLMAMMCRSRGP